MINVVLKYLFIFMVGGIGGWLIDSAYRSVCERRRVFGTWLPYFSLCYAAGNVMLYVLFLTSPGGFWAQVMLGTAVCIAWELLAGILAAHILHRRLWDYQKNKFNFRGYIDVLHSFYWLLLTVIYRIIFGIIY